MLSIKLSIYLHHYQKVCKKNRNSLIYLTLRIVLLKNLGRFDLLTFVLDIMPFTLKFFCALLLENHKRTGSYNGICTLFSNFDLLTLDLEIMAFYNFYLEFLSMAYA